MELNRTAALTDVHPCYKIDVSQVLIRNPSPQCVLVQIFLFSLAVITICGNLLVIISIIYFKQLHTPSNSLILSLAMADMLVGLLVFPLTWEFPLTSCLFQKDLFCEVRGTFEVLLCTSSILNLCCISIDRYHAVCLPLTYRSKISYHVTVSMILMSWGIAALIAISFIIVGVNQEKCAANCLSDVILANIFGLILSFYLPVIILLCIYLKIFLVAQRQARSIQSTKSGVTLNKTERKATKTLAVVVGIFFLCWFPFFLCTTVLSFSLVHIPLPLIEFLVWLAMSNSMLNPFIYAFFYNWFRSAFKMIICGKIIRGDFTNSKLF